MDDTDGVAALRIEVASLRERLAATEKRLAQSIQGALAPRLDEALSREENLMEELEGCRDDLVRTREKLAEAEAAGAAMRAVLEEVACSPYPICARHHGRSCDCGGELVRAVIVQDFGHRAPAHDECDARAASPPLDAPGGAGS